MEAKYRVYITERERGWGSRPCGHKDFDSLKKALAFQKKENAENNLPYVPDIYYIAEDPVLVPVKRAK